MDTNNFPTDVIDVMCDAGFSPTEDADSPVWIGRYDGYIATDDGFIVANIGADQLILQALTVSGAIRTELRFPAGEMMMYPLERVAFAAVVATWCAL